MSVALTPPEVNVHENVFDDIAEALFQKGYYIGTSPLPVDLCANLYQHVYSLDQTHLSQAGIGRQQEHQVNEAIRTDLIHWIDRNTVDTRQYLDWMETLRLEINRRLFLGLFDYECHFACYPSGAYYKKHLDAFKGETNRVLTTVLYLNPEWSDWDGGELLLYDGENEIALERVRPDFGRMVIFLSERFPHEVLTAHRNRYSVAGWFRVNNSIGNNLDVPA